MNQDFLNTITNKQESKLFLDNVNNWDSHRPLLYLGLELTKSSNSPILELGCGDGSTIHLNKYIQYDNRKLISFDTNENWLNKYSHLKSEKHEFKFEKDNYFHNHITKQYYDKTPEIVNWLDNISANGLSVCLVDHACGERRHSDLKRIYEKCDVMIIHDSEPQSTGYLLDKIWHLFKYSLHFKQFEAWATIVSNKYDVTAFDNMKIGQYQLTKLY